ncbi:glycine zipper 2TM domain-containing protein [Qipengyuania qiaonensis]|uniref:17 kDa surface antigen n=1 Tax=Qipengyuania qiaonensis TaxID=2867240 RepID=A0ABS7J6W6_9SPHN|nr:glycine zipper 2TM domain-containing protein [Qipengyuania qiaonensis]MBX7483055.1 glycine zipper 2TM domain-containing protein [Qipengyuania qiaonensis]
MSKLLKSASIALATSGLALAMPASAAPAMHASPGAHVAATGDMTFQQYRDRYDRRYRDYRGYDRYDSRYDRRSARRDRDVWRGQDGRYYCRRDNGTTGLVIGAGVGALAGHEIAGRGDRTLGAILGGAAGALLGRTIDRSGSRCE